jgi:hypothetical protein
VPLSQHRVVQMPLLERIYAWSLRRIFKYNFDTQLLTAFAYPISIRFEWRAWRQLRRLIFAGEFDLVLRFVLMTPSLPGPFLSSSAGSDASFGQESDLAARPGTCNRRSNPRRSRCTNVIWHR